MSCVGVRRLYALSCGKTDAFWQSKSTSKFAAARLEICCMLIKICAVGPDRVHETSPLECEGFVALRTMKICRMGAKKASECHETRNLCTLAKRQRLYTNVQFLLLVQ